MLFQATKNIIQNQRTKFNPHDDKTYLNKHMNDKTYLSKSRDTPFMLQRRPGAPSRKSFLAKACFMRLRSLVVGLHSPGLAHAWYHTSSNKRLVTPPTNQPIYVFLYRSSCSCCLPHNLSIDQLEPSNGEGSGVHKLGWRAQVVGGRSAKSNGAGSGVRKLCQLARVSCVDSSWPAALGQHIARSARQSPRDVIRRPVPAGMGRLPWP